jgi:hypothetical protein
MREKTMNQNEHTHVVELHTKAAYAHTAAIHEHSTGDHASPQDLAKEALARSVEAASYSESVGKEMLLLPKL